MAFPDPIARHGAVTGGLGRLARWNSRRDGSWGLYGAYRASRSVWVVEVSAAAYLVLHCDHHNPDGQQCDAEGSYAGWAANHRELRRHLKGHGWRRTRDGRDLCPDHANQK